jgi:hypothetical protein
LEGLRLVAQALVGEGELVLDVELGWEREDVHLLAVPPVVVAGLFEEDLLGEGVGDAVEGFGVDAVF